jgi:hypothetical protein
MHSTEPRLQIEEVDTAMLSGDQWRAVLQLCDEAYEEPTQQFFADVGPGRHFLGYADRNLVTHLMVVERSLQPAGDPALRTAYVELVATAPYQQGKGYASTLLRRLSTAFPTAPCCRTGWRRPSCSRAASAGTRARCSWTWTASS